MNKVNSIVWASTLTIGLVTMAGCTGYSASSNLASVGAASNSLPFMQAKVAMTITDSNNVTVYPNAGVSTLMRAGVTYTLNLDVTNAPPGTTYSLALTDIDQIGATATNITLQAGANSFTVPVQGDYSMKLVATATGFTPQTSNFQIQVSCPNPTPPSLNPSAIAVTNGSSPNFYNYSAAGVIVSGSDSYSCAWDPTGTGIVDSAFQDCGTAASLYDNYVAGRSIGLVVKDTTCNMTYSISNNQTLAYTEPSMPGNNFIFGVTSGATGNAVGDKRVDGVTYLADNLSKNPIVSTQYGNGNFNIFGWQNYKIGSSVQFGVQIKVQGLVETTPINATTGAGAVDASHASISSVEYVTDEAGDQQPSEVFAGTASNCTLSNQGARVLPIVGQPCSGGTSGDQNSVTVEVWGHYSCTALTSAGGTTNIVGDFDGDFDIADSCSGGGQGGGGVAPPGF